MSVTVVTSCYGNHARFVPAWLNAIKALDPAPYETIVASDKPLGLPADVTALVAPCDWKHPQAFYLNLAIHAAETEWVWIADVDDLPYPYALAGLAEVAADVWQMGYDRVEEIAAGEFREWYTVPQLTADEYLALDTNPFVGSSAIRTEAFRAVGGFHDVAFQDWDLWRRMALAGMSFQSSRRTHFRYVTHDAARSQTELTPDRRAEHVSEMFAFGDEGGGWIFTEAIHA